MYLFLVRFVLILIEVVISNFAKLGIWFLLCKQIIKKKVVCLLCCHLFFSDNQVENTMLYLFNSFLWIFWLITLWYHQLHDAVPLRKVGSTVESPTSSMVNFDHISIDDKKLPHMWVFKRNLRRISQPILEFAIDALIPVIVLHYFIHDWLWFTFRWWCYHSCNFSGRRIF